KRRSVGERVELGDGSKLHSASVERGHGLGLEAGVLDVRRPRELSRDDPEVGARPSQVWPEDTRVEFERRGNIDGPLGDNLANGISTGGTEQESVRPHHDAPARINDDRRGAVLGPEAEVELLE